MTSQLAGVWHFARANDPGKAEIRLHVNPGNRRPFDAQLLLVDSSNVRSFPKRESFDSPLAALQFVRERRGALLAEGWTLAGSSDLAKGVDLDDHSCELRVPAIATGIAEGVWTYRYPADNSIAQLRVRVALHENAPYGVSSDEFDEHFQACHVVARRDRFSRQAQALAFLQTEARALFRQGWEMIGAAGLACQIDLLAELCPTVLPQAVHATQEAAWEFRDTLTGEERKGEILVHTDRAEAFEICWYSRRPMTTRWYPLGEARQFSEYDEAILALRDGARAAAKSGFALVQGKCLGYGIDLLDESQQIPFRDVCREVGPLPGNVVRLR